MTMLQVSLLDIAKTHYKIEPEDVQKQIAVIVLPWSFKFFYGIFTDIVPLCGSRKKNYIIAAGGVQCISTFLLGYNKFESIKPFLFLAGTMMGCFSVMDTVIDGLMVK